MARASYAADDLGTGRFSGGKVTFESLRVEEFDFRGKAPAKVGVWVDMIDEDGQVHNQFYSIGKPEYVQIVDENDEPTDSGVGVAHVDPEQTYRVSKNSAWGMFVTALQKAGFPSNKLSKGDVTVMAGLSCEVQEIALPKRPGMESENAATLIVVSKIFDAKGAKTAASAKASSAKAKAAAADDADEDEDEDDDVDPIELKASEAVATVLADPKKYITGYKKGPIAKKDLINSMFKVLRGDKQLSQVAKKVGNDAFLAGGAEWNFDADEQTIEAL